MHIHMPKALHSLREAMGEIAIVVVGIVIAIALEQGVEQLHWASEVGKARASLHSEMAHDNRSFAFRVAAEPCIGRRLDELEQVIEASARHEPVPHLGRLIPDIGNALDDNIWQDHRAAQTLTHFKDDELDGLGAYYMQVGSIRGFIGEEVQAWGVLRVLQGDPARLGPADIAGLRVAIQHARFDNFIIAGIAKDQLDAARSLGAPVRPADAARVAEVCAPLPVTTTP